MKHPVPATIEGRCQVMSIDAQPVHQPIFNHWRNALPLLALIGLRLLWVLFVHY